jgi:hypothetical protein
MWADRVRVRGQVMKAVRFDRYGGIEVLQVADVGRKRAATNQRQQQRHERMAPDRICA